MNIFTSNLFVRLLVSYLVTVLLGLGVSGLFMSFFTKEFIYETKQEELLRKAKQVNGALQDSNRIDEGKLSLLSFLDRSFEARIWVFNNNGEIIATSMKDEVFIGKSIHPSIVDKVKNGKDVIQELNSSTFEGLDKPMLSVVVPWGKQDELYGGIVLHAPIEGITEAFSNMRETILWATLFGILLSTVMVSYLSWSISRPLKKIERTAAEIGMGNYDRRVEIESTAEIGDLAQTINTLAEKLEAGEKERRRLDQIRNDFFANISHELRTPLTAMQGFLEALQDGLIEDEDARQRYYQAMYQETMHLNRMVNDLMDLIKLENHDLVLSRVPVDVEALLQKVAWMFQQEAKQKKSRIMVQVPSSLPRVYGDRDRVFQIIQNLVKNAVKFTEEGQVTLSAEEDGKYIKIMVRDTGIGISEDDLTRIWERFFKVDRVRTKKNDGTGLGLSIVKQLVELHDGKIEVQSEPGVGTVFTVWLPQINKLDNSKTDKAINF
ncbi:MAG: HAMP domain-containing protein [Bacillaceae bacterium]|nr:HAMP domain-containing protein [Bacillaceae bacterium]